MSMESEERAKALRIAVVFVALMLLAVIFMAFFAIPAIASWADAIFSPGLGMRSAAIIASVVSFIVIIVFASVSGDGLLGEIQYVIPGFFLFFLFFWLMLAWVF